MGENVCFWNLIEDPTCLYRSAHATWSTSEGEELIGTRNREGGNEEWQKEQRTERGFELGEGVAIGGERWGPLG
jgi:hypothetical protein